jgi:hypothetical protein
MDLLSRIETSNTLRVFCGLVFTLSGIQATETHDTNVVLMDFFVKEQEYVYGIIIPEPTMLMGRLFLGFGALIALYGMVSSYRYAPAKQSTEPLSTRLIDWFVASPTMHCYMAVLFACQMTIATTHRDPGLPTFALNYHGQHYLIGSDLHTVSQRMFAALLALLIVAYFFCFLMGQIAGRPSAELTE